MIDAGLQQSLGTRSLSGHAWISYTNENGQAQTFGTYGRSDVGIVNLQENLEQGITPDVSIAATLNDAQEQALFGYITNPNTNQWGYFDNCSNFACGAWEAAGQKSLSNRNWFGVPNPNNLANSIEKRLKEQQSSDGDFESSSPLEDASVPEPGTLTLVGFGIAMIVLCNRRKNTRRTRNAAFT